MKTPDRTLHWARRCTLINAQALSTFSEHGRTMLIDFCKRERDLAQAEGYDDTATYIQHVLDDLEDRK